MSDFFNKKKSDETWVITYYETGMTPRKKYFDTEEEAIETWDKWVDDAWKGAHSLVKQITLRRKVDRVRQWVKQIGRALASSAGYLADTLRTMVVAEKAIV